MKTYFKIFLLSLSLFIMSCSDDMFTYNVDDEEQQTITEQIITGAGDCISNTGWSWSDGVASVRSSTENFSFKTTVAGKLSFSYRRNSNSYKSSLTVTINNKIYFNEEDNFPSNYSEISIGSVKADETVIFSGNNCEVKNIKIVEESK